MNLKVLVVDDVSMFVELEKDFLQLSAVKVLTARDGQQALKICQDERPDLVFTDLHMPWMNGATVLRGMRNAGVQTPFVVVTGMDPAAIERLLDQLDRVTVLRKPVSLPELRGVVRALLADNARKHRGLDGGETGGEDT